MVNSDSLGKTSNNIMQILSVKGVVACWGRLEHTGDLKVTYPCSLQLICWNFKIPLPIHYEIHARSLGPPESLHKPPKSDPIYHTWMETGERPDHSISVGGQSQSSVRQIGRYTSNTFSGPFQQFARSGPSPEFWTQLGALIVITKKDGDLLMMLCPIS